jgi:NAD(P)-dependent dehydrogenase (short-subunit alcohol dehydrogenase family)
VQAGSRKPLEEMSADDRRAVIDTNLTGNFLVTRRSFR